MASAADMSKPHGSLCDVTVTVTVMVTVTVVQGLYRRGLQLEAMREFILSQGASKNVTLMVTALGPDCTRSVMSQSRSNCMSQDIASGTCFT